MMARAAAEALGCDVMSLATLQFYSAVGLAAGVGLSLSLLGAGGSILAVPLLVYVARMDAHRAIAISLAIVGGTSAVGALLHHREGWVRLRAALWFGLCGLPGAYLGAHLSHWVPDWALMLAFAALMLVVGAAMLRPAPESIEAGAPAPIPVLLAAGTGVGFLTGFLGVGGGFLIVPALTLLVGLPIREAVATSLVVIAANCASGLVSQWQQGGLHLLEGVPYLTASATGAAIGTRLAGRFSAGTIRRGFALAVIALGLAIGVSQLLR
jgi:hypothetical protein